MDGTDWKSIARKLLLTAAATSAALSWGCKHPADAQGAAASDETVSRTADPATTSPASNGPSTAPAPVDYQDKGAHFQYPATWKPKTDKDYELHLIPAAGEGNRDITFDIPDLPPHFPGMIRLGLIENGYVNDLKKQHAGLHVDESADFAVGGGAKARLVESSWNQGGTAHSDVGLLMMRNDEVYILSCNADAKDLAATRADFDKVVASLHWDK